MEVTDQIAEWIRKHVNEASCSGAVFGLSGGIDSSVVAALCKKALGKNNLGMILPCFSYPGDQEDASKVAESLNIETITVSLDDIYSLLEKRLPAAPRLTKANLKPRLRMICLYYLASLHSSLVIGSGNKTELKVGYFTKYGDGGVDILPLGGLYKSEVRQLAIDLDLPEEIISKKPSAGLWEGQTDEDELGISYETLDKTLKAIDNSDTEGIDGKVLKRVQDLMAKAAHKVRMPPVFES